MPIFGDFIKKVLNDKRFSKYKAKFAEAKDIDPSLWSGSDYAPAPDSTLTEETGENENEIEDASQNNDVNDAKTEVIATEE